jgi:dipeptidyl-peptidase-4
MLASPFAAAFAAATTIAAAQDRLPTMPGYENYTKMAPVYQQNPMISGAIGGGGGGGRGGGAQGAAQTGITWAADGRSVQYTHNGRRYNVDIAARRVAELPAEAQPAAQAQANAANPGRAGRAGRAGGGGAPPGGGGGRGGGAGGGNARCGVSLAVERGRQSALAQSPDGRLVSIHKNRNLYIANADCSGEYAVTTDGNEAANTKYGTGSWVYGEELGQNTAMWWNRAGNKLGYYRFDETGVLPFFLTLSQAQVNTELDAERYPKAGAQNPLAEIFVYDLATRRSTRMDVRDGKPNVDSTVGYYVYGVRWTPNDRELLVERTNRLQNIMELAACSPETGRCRVVFREEWLTGWVENSPPMRYLADSNRFILTSERNGYNNYYLHDLSGRLINAITSNQFEASSIVRLDEASNTMWYMARSGDNFMKQQLHRVRLDGSGNTRLTDPQYTHSVTLSPDGRYFIDVAQNNSTPPFTRLIDASNGSVIAELARSDVAAPQRAGIKRVEQFTFTAADGRTRLYGAIHKPINFDSTKKYPVILNVYGGPASGSNTPTENFTWSSPSTEYGFIVVNLHTRASPGMGKRMLDALYLKLGQTEIDDMAAGIRELGRRSYINAQRVGIAGTSYGGYSSAMAILRYPDLFHAAVANSAVTAWNHYDTIYTERYMSTPQLNPDGYRLGAAMPYAANLKGRLLIYFGTADNNVHPNNAMQLIAALQQAGKNFEVQVGPDRGHTAVNGARQWEFFIENLAMR